VRLYLDELDCETSNLKHLGRGNLIKPMPAHFAESTFGKQEDAVS